MKKFNIRIDVHKTIDLCVEAKNEKEAYEKLSSQNLCASKSAIVTIRDETIEKVTNEKGKDITEKFLAAAYETLT